MITLTPIEDLQFPCDCYSPQPMRILEMATPAANAFQYLFLVQDRRMASGPVIFNNNSSDDLYVSTFDDKDIQCSWPAKSYRVAPFQKNVVIDAPTHPGNRAFLVHLVWEQIKVNGGRDGGPWAREDGYPLIRCLRGSTWEYSGHVSPLRRHRYYGHGWYYAVLLLLMLLS